MWLIIVGALLAIIFIIVLSPVRINVSVNDIILVKVKFLFFSVYTFDSREKDEKENNEIVTETDNIQTKITKITGCSNNYDRLVLIIKTLKSLLCKFQKLLKHTVIKKFNFNISISGNDAADTAVKYGKVCSVVYPLSTLLCECVNFKPDNISVYSNFNGGQTEFNLGFTVSTKLIYIIYFAVLFVFDFLKLRMGVKSK